MNFFDEKLPNLMLYPVNFISYIKYPKDPIPTSIPAIIDGGIFIPINDEIEAVIIDESINAISGKNIAAMAVVNNIMKNKNNFSK